MELIFINYVAYLLQVKIPTSEGLDWKNSILIKGEMPCWILFPFLFQEHGHQQRAREGKTDKKEENWER